MIDGNVLGQPASEDSIAHFSRLVERKAIHPVLDDFGEDDHDINFQAFFESGQTNGPIHDLTVELTHDPEGTSKGTLLVWGFSNIANPIDTVDIGRLLQDPETEASGVVSEESQKAYIDDYPGIAVSAFLRAETSLLLKEGGDGETNTIVAGQANDVYLLSGRGIPIAKRGLGQDVVNDLVAPEYKDENLPFDTDALIEHRGTIYVPATHRTLVVASLMLHRFGLVDSDTAAFDGAPLALDGISNEVLPDIQKDIAFNF